MTLEGTVRGRFRVLNEISRNRGAVTVRAVDETTGRDVVVKRLSVANTRANAPRGVESLSGGDADKAIELFRREATTLGSLAGTPGVPRLVDFFEEHKGNDVLLFLVQEWIPGRTLGDEIAGGKRLDPVAAAGIGRAIASVLAALHARTPPVVHRDVKPSNVLLVEGGGVALLDFGAVRSGLSASVLDASTVVGTHGYMPPEQYEGHAVPASDVYALGVTLLEASTGLTPVELPRNGGRIDVDAAGAPPFLAGVLARMTEPSLDRRLRNGDEVDAEIAAALSPPPPAEGLEASLARASGLLGASMPALHGVLMLSEDATPEAIAQLGPDATRLAESLRRGPRSAVDLLAEARWSVDAALALSKLQEAGFIAVEAPHRGRIVLLAAFLVLAAVSAVLAFTRLPSFWAGDIVWTLAGLAGLLVSLVGAVMVASRLRLPR